MWIGLTNGVQIVVFLGLVLSGSIWSPDYRAIASETPSMQSEFSGTIIKQVNRKKHQV